MSAITDPPRPPIVWLPGMDKRLGPMERELFCAAAQNNGRVVILRKNDGEWVRIGSQDFVDTEADPNRRQKALAARARLLELGCTGYNGDGESLTRRGWAIANRLRTT